MATFRKSVLQKLFFFLLASSTFAVPIANEDGSGIADGAFALVKRVPAGTVDDPYDVYFDTSNWADIAEEDCRIALCELGGQRLYQRQPSEAEADQAYTQSGARLNPFYAANLSDRHTTQINPLTTSAEEFPFRSIQLQLDQRRYVVPATLAQQNSQGNAIGRAYRNAGVPYNQWFRLHFTGSPWGPYCRALFQNPPDIHICTSKPKQTLFGTTNVDLSQQVYVKADQKEGNTIVFDHSNA